MAATKTKPGRKPKLVVEPARTKILVSIDIDTLALLDDLANMYGRDRSHQVEALVRQAALGTPLQAPRARKRVG